MNVWVKSFVLVALPVLAGCAVDSYCEGEQDYYKEGSVPPLKGAEGLQIPESASALKIPPPPTNPVPYGETVKDEDGDDVVRCLDKPPPLPPQPVEPKPEEKKPS
jgi:hypothetical protein